MAQKVKPFATVEDVEKREAWDGVFYSDKQLASMSTAEVEALNLLYVPGFS